MTGEDNQDRLTFGLIADRSAVLFIGMVVGAVLGVSFYTEGKPFQALSEPFQPSAKVAPAKPGRAAKANCATAYPMSPRVAEALQKKTPIRIGVFGDSFGDGIWAGTLQELAGRKDFQVFQFSKESTGLTRYKSVDIYADTQRKITDQPIDVAFISFGANDTQGVWDKGKAAAYMTQPWQDIIGGRARDLVHLLQGQGIAVGWVGLPRMRRASYDDQIQQMNGFYQRVMCDLGVPFINPVAVSQDANQKFAKELVDPQTGKTYFGRADDGIHMSIHGYRVMVRPLVQKIVALTPSPKPSPAPSPIAPSQKAAR